MYSAFRIPLKILHNHKLYRISIDSHQMDVTGIWAPHSTFKACCQHQKMICAHCHVVYIIGACQVRDREKEIETGDRQMNRRRETGEPVEEHS